MQVPGVVLGLVILPMPCHLFQVVHRPESILFLAQVLIFRFASHWILVGFPLDSHWGLIGFLLDSPWVFIGVSFSYAMLPDSNELLTHSTERLTNSNERLTNSNEMLKNSNFWAPQAKQFQCNSNTIPVKGWKIPMQFPVLGIASGVSWLFV